MVSGYLVSMPMFYSVIIPVYNRPDEVDELLQSLTSQSFKNFEVIIVEDGSSVPCETVTQKYAELLQISYYSKPNSGPGRRVITGRKGHRAITLLYWIPIASYPKIISRRWSRS